MEKKRSIIKVIKSAVICVLMLAGATGIGYVCYSLNLLDTNIVMIYMLCVLFVTSMTEGFLYGIITAFLSMGAFNYFFIVPYYSLDVDNSSYIIALVSMLFAAVITSMITSKSQMNEKAAKERERETTLLLQLTNQVTGARSIGEIAESMVKYAGSILACDMDCMITQEDGRLGSRFLSQKQEAGQKWEELAEKEQLEQAVCGSNWPEHTDSVTHRNWPIYGQDGLLAIVRIPIKEAEQLRQSQLRMFISMQKTAGLAMERLRVREQQMRSSLLMEKERYRSTLLRSISHDLRTPLAGIMGTSGMLLDMIGEEDPKSRLVKDIGQDAQWLYGLVENVLSLTRLRDSEMVRREPEACEEVIEAAVRKVESRAMRRRLQVQVPGECLIAPMDAHLMEQVLVNLLDNAIKHTAEDGEISVSVKLQQKDAVFEVTDNGRGIPEEDLPYIFEMFYTTKGMNTDKKKGIGIGLAICEAVIKAHGGSIDAMNRKNGGTTFRFNIPLEETVSSSL